MSVENNRLDQETRPYLLQHRHNPVHWQAWSAETLALMNEYFVNVKVDREERPDVDYLYQQALMMMGRRGGWPLTMFLTPDGKPFWGGTYFPPFAQGGRPGFAEVLQTIAELWRNHAVAELRSNGERVRDDLLAHIAPLGWEHITFNGDYVWPTEPLQNAFRPLRNPRSELLDAA
jgi:uncharacterized protein YyaL (SSP411 family)